MNEEIREIPYVGEARAERLHGAGFKNREDLQDATRDDIIAIQGLDEGIADRVVTHFADNSG